MYLPGSIYILCTLLSGGCSYLLFKAFREKKFKILFWSSCGFLGFSINNLMLFIDLIVINSADLSVWRTIPALVGVVTLLYGLITDTV